MHDFYRAYFVYMDFYLYICTMSRFKEWTGTYSHVGNYLLEKGYTNDKNMFTEAKKLIYKFTEEGSFSDRCMHVRKNYSKFINWVHAYKKENK
jgi:hypothetical protein